MLAYRSDERMCDPRHVLNRLAIRTRAAAAGPSHEEVRELFVDFGEIEAAIVDCIFPDRTDCIRLRTH